MCNTVVVVDASHSLAIADAIVELCDHNILFTAFDVTRTARAAVGNFMARHKILKSETRRMYQAQEFPTGYSRCLVDIGGVETYVYYPLNLDPYQYDPQTLFPDSDDVPIDSIATVPSSNGIATTADCRLNIPQKLLAKMNLNRGDIVYVELDNTNNEIKITPVPATVEYPATIEYDTLSINADGSVRISQTALVKAFGSVGVYEITSNDASSAADIVLTIKPL